MMHSRIQVSPARLMTALFIAIGVGASGCLAQAGGKTAPPPPKSAQTGIDVPRIAYTRFVLANGLVVILHEDHSSPIVAIDLAYHVGSADERMGKRGLAHMFEHSMFDGSAHVAAGEHIRILQEAGANPNAGTREDRTSYVEQVPSNMLETALWLEAERMAFLPARFDSARFELQRASVFNEYGQNVEGSAAGVTNRGPYDGSLGREVVQSSLFPDPNPYHVTPFGVMSEVKTATLGDYRAFFDKYYGPNNATLVLVGDFAIAGARRMVERYFGGIPKHAAVTHPAVPNAALTGETRLVLEDRVANTQQLWIGWRGVSATSSDRLALSALGAILAGGATSRLSRILITERRLAVAVPQSGHFDLEHVGVFQLLATAAPNGSLTEIERVIDSVLTDVRDNGVTSKELQRWLGGFTISSITQLEPAANKAGLLEDGEVIYKDPGAELNDIDGARRLTVADLQRVARQYLTPARVVLSIVPPGKTELASKPNEPYKLVTREKAP